MRHKKIEKKRLKFKTRNPIRLEIFKGLKIIA